MSDSTRDTILEVIEASLEAQLNAVRRLRKSVSDVPAKGKKGTSQIDMAKYVLLEAGQPLHLNQIIAQMQEKFSFKADPDSLGSALTKRVVKGQVFCRPAKNTFGLLEDSDAR